MSETVNICFFIHILIYARAILCSGNSTYGLRSKTCIDEKLTEMAFLKIINYVRLRQKNEMDILMGGAVVDTPSRSYPPLLDNAGGVLAFNL